MLKSTDDKNWRVQFNSLWELTQHLKTEPHMWGHVKDSERQPATKSWDLEAGYAGALKLAAEGWEAGVRDMTALCATVPNNVLAVKSYSMAGEFPDVPRYLAGDPNNMVHRGKEKVPKPTMSIVLNIAVSGAVSADSIWKYGAAVAALVDRLESRRVRCEVIACWSVSDTTYGSGSKRFSASWTVKHAEDALDMSAMAFSLAHPAMLRRLGFAVMERCTVLAPTASYYYPSDVRDTDLVDCPSGALLINGLGLTTESGFTMEQMIARVKAQFNNAAGEDIVELEEAA